MKTFIINTIKRAYLIVFSPLLIIGPMLGKIIGPEYDVFKLNDWLALMKDPSQF